MIKSNTYDGIMCVDKFIVLRFMHLGNAWKEIFKIIWLFWTAQQKIYHGQQFNLLHYKHYTIRIFNESKQSDGVR